MAEVRISDLLQRKQNEDLSLSAGQWLQSLPDDRTGTVHADAGDFQGLGIHRMSRHVAGDQKVSDPNWMFRRVHFDLDPPCRRDFRFVGAGLAQEKSRTRADDSRHLRIVGSCRLGDVIGVFSAQDNDCPGIQRAFRRNPFRNVLIFRGEIAGRGEVTGNSGIANSIEPEAFDVVCSKDQRPVVVGLDDESVACRTRGDEHRHIRGRHTGIDVCAARTKRQETAVCRAIPLNREPAEADRRVGIETSTEG